MKNVVLGKWYYDFENSRVLVPNTKVSQYTYDCTVYPIFWYGDGFDYEVDTNIVDWAIVAENKLLSL